MRFSQSVYASLPPKIYRLSALHAGKFNHITKPRGSEKFEQTIAQVRETMPASGQLETFTGLSRMSPAGGRADVACQGLSGPFLANSRLKAVRCGIGY